MKVLFIIDELFPSTNANSRIVFRVIDELLHYPDLQVEILGQAHQVLQRADNYHGCRIIHTPFRRYQKYLAVTDKLGSLKRLRYLIYPRTIMYRIARFRGFNNPYVWEAMRWVKRNCHNYDAIIAMSMPYYNLEIASSVGDKVPVILYPLEPIAAFNKSADDFEKRLDYEISLESRASKLILTSLIHQDFLSERTRINENKVLEAEFPCIFSRDPLISEITDKTDKRISLVFVGRFYEEYREPDFLCRLLDCLPENEYDLTIVGGLTFSNYKPAIVNRYLSNTHPFIHCVGFVLQDVADTYLQKADILVHVGNKQPNLMPSKILDYISTGKPIINLCKTRQCPTLPLMEKYPLGLMIFEEDGLNETITARVDEFCKKVKGQRVPFETIQRLYYKYTPEYVGSVFYRAIQSSVDEFKSCVE